LLLLYWILLANRLIPRLLGLRSSLYNIPPTGS